MENYSEDRSVIFEIGSGALTALGILVDEKALEGREDPTIFPTLDETRVIMAFNEQVFRGKVEALFEQFTRQRPDLDPEAIRLQCEESLTEAMGQLCELLLDIHFSTTGVSHLAEPLDQGI